MVTSEEYGLRVGGSDKKLFELLMLVVETYLEKWDPIGSKFLHSLNEMDYAPSTLRKYLHVLEDEGMLEQPYNSSGRVPTIEGVKHYVEKMMWGDKTPDLDVKFEVDYARSSVRHLVESLAEHIDGVTVGFLKDDEYYFLGINNLLKDTKPEEYSKARDVIDFIEKKGVIPLLDAELLPLNKIGYKFVQDGETIISCVYAKVVINGFDSMISIVGPLRLDYKRNIQVLQQFIEFINRKALGA